VSGGKSGRRQRPLASTRAQWGGRFTSGRGPRRSSGPCGAHRCHAALGMLQNGATTVELKCGNDDGKNSDNRSLGPLFIGKGVMQVQGFVLNLSLN
jgi:hypothetical protein